MELVETIKPDLKKNVHFFYHKSQINSILHKEKTSIRMKNKSDIFNTIALQKYQEAIQHIKTVESRGRREEYPGYIQASNLLDELHIYEKLKWYCSELSYRRIRHKEGLDHNLEDFRFMSHIFEVVDDNSTTFDNRGIVIFNEIRKIQEHQLEGVSVSVAKIQSINNLVLKSVDVLGIGDVIRALSMLSGASITELNKGNLDFAKLFIHINHEIIHHSFKQKKRFKLPPGMYKNIVTVMINIQDENFYKEVENELLEVNYDKTADDKFKWVMRFIKTYKSFLSKKDAEIYYNYCMGYTHFSKKEYQPAHEHLKSLKRKRGMFIK